MSFLSSDFPINRVFVSVGYTTLLNLACRFGRLSCAKYLLRFRHAGINRADIYGMTPCLEAAWHGQLRIVQLLIRMHEETETSNDRPVSHSYRATDTTTYTNIVDKTAYRKKVLVDNYVDMRTYFEEDGDGNLSRSITTCGEDGGPSPSSYLLDLSLRGSPPITSVCGGRGPFTAEEWAKRKSEVCPERSHFGAIYKLLCLERVRQESLRASVAVV
jgi:hypothetical protein